MLECDLRWRLCESRCCDLSFVWLCPDGFMSDFIVIDVIYYFLIAYNVWLYIYVFRRILLFLYVVECRFCLVFIGFMLFMVLWSYFLFMQNFTIVHSRMYRRTPLLYIFCISMNIHYVYYIQYIYNPYIVRIVLNPYTIRISAQSACYPVHDLIQNIQ